MPSSLEPTGLYQDGGMKQHDGITYTALENKVLSTHLTLQNEYLSSY